MKDANCGYCMRGELLDKFGIFICDLKVSSLILFKEQSHPGRCIVAYKDQVNLRSIRRHRLPAAHAPVPEVQGRFRVGRHFRDESRQDLFDGCRISGDDRQNQGEPVNIPEHFPRDYIE